MILTIMRIILRHWVITLQSGRSFFALGIPFCFDPEFSEAGMNGLNFASFFNDNAGTITLFIIYCIIIAIIVYYPHFIVNIFAPMQRWSVSLVNITFTIVAMTNPMSRKKRLWKM